MRIYIEFSQDPYDSKTPSVKSAYISSPFEAKDDIKALPVRRWNPARKRWVIPESDVEVAAARLRGAGHVVEILEQKKEKRTRANGEKRKYGFTWADDMFAQLPERFHDPVHRSLTKILHPDIGGDLDAMQALNIARDRVKGAA